MNASRFNAVYNELVIAPLVRGGFVQRRSNVYLVAGDAVLALLRFQNGPEALLQGTNVIVCVRHTFLRELQDLTVPDVFVSDINDYPVRNGSRRCLARRMAGGIDRSTLTFHQTTTTRLITGA